MQWRRRVEITRLRSSHVARTSQGSQAYFINSIYIIIIDLKYFQGLLSPIDNFTYIVSKHILPFKPVSIFSTGSTSGIVHHISGWLTEFSTCTQHFIFFKNIDHAESKQTKGKTGEYQISFSRRFAAIL